MKATAALLIVLLAAASAGAEELSEIREPARILALLDSEVLAEQAWGAFLAGREGVREAIPRLAEFLKPLPEREGAEWEHLRYAVLDALVLLKARVPGEIAPELIHANAKSKGWRTALILLSRQPEKNAGVLLSMFGFRDWEHFGNGPLAIGNLLCAVRAKGFAARLLAGLPTELSITVKDPDANISGAGYRAFGGRGDAYLRLPEGFPPYARYLFWNKKLDGAVLLADGPRPVYYTRRERTGKGLMTGIDGANHTASEVVLEWLGDLLNTEPESFGFRERHNSILYWETVEKLLADAEKAREKALRPWRDMAARCLTAGYVTEEEFEVLEPILKVEVRDDRKDKSVPLPDLAGD